MLGFGLINPIYRVMKMRNVGPLVTSVATSLIAVGLFALTVPPETAAQNLGLWLQVVDDPAGAVRVAFGVALLVGLVWTVIRTVSEWRRPAECG